MKVENKKLFALSGFAVVAVAAGLVMATYTSNSEPQLRSIATGESKSKTLSNTELQSVTFEGLDITDNRDDGTEVKHDKKFKIQLDEYRYILGAVIYHDCDHQYIGTESEAGASLGDAFTMDNSKQGSANAFNFHIAFSLENIESFSYTFTTRLTNDKESSGGHVFLGGIKYRQYVNNGTDASFYNDLTTAGYNGILKDNYQGGYYSQMDRAATSQTVPINNSREDTSALICTGNWNMAVIQFSSDSNLWEGRVISFTLNSLTFTYHCN